MHFHKIAMLTIITLIHLYAICTYVYADNAGNNCFENIINSEDRLEVYPGSFWATNDISKKAYIQYKGDVPGLGENAIVLFDRGDRRISHDRLCNNNIIIIWEEQETSRSPALIYGKVLDSNLKTHIDDFRIVDNEKAQGAVSVGSLLNNNFVVTWQRLMREKDNSTHTVIYARIFNSYGKPLSKSLEVSMMRGINARAIAHGLPDGGFVILWERLRDSASTLLRIYNRDGSPRTKEILICYANLSWPNTPYVKVLSSGTINIFLVHDNYLNQNKPIELARSYDSTGKALTHILDVHSSPQLEGYQDIVECIVYKNARMFEDDLRRFINNDSIMSRDFCRYYKLDRKFRGNSLLKWTKSQSMIKYINDFYNKQEDLCSKKIQK